LRNASWTSEAYSDFLNIIEFIKSENLLAAVSLATRLISKVEDLRVNPFAYRAGKVAETREALVTKRYVIVYKVTMDEVRILRILHTSRKWP